MSLIMATPGAKRRVQNKVITSIVPASTWNPLDKDPDIVLSNGNLNAATSPSVWGAVRATIGKSAGDRYFTVTAATTGPSNSYTFIGIANSTAVLINRYVGQTGAAGIKGASLYGNALIWQNWTGSLVQTAGTGFAAGTVVGVRVNFGTNTLSFYNDGTGALLATVTNAALTGEFFPSASIYATGAVSNLNCSGPFANLPVGASAWDS